MVIIKDLWDSEDKELIFADMQLTISNGVLNITSEKYLIEFDIYSSVFAYLQKKNITRINIQNMYSLNVDSIISCCSHYNISDMHVSWDKDTATDTYKMKFVMDQSIWSIITKGICTYDLTN